VHELAIAESIVAIATRHAGDDGRVTEVHVRVGRLRQVVPSALEFAFELCAQGTAAEGAALRLEDVPVAAACRACRAGSEPEGFPLACPACGSFDLEIVGGEELVVDSLELEREVTRSGG
jgi:hydrogenase nickel incorporation protein HypA/HybF